MRRTAAPSPHHLSSFEGGRRFAHTKWSQSRTFLVHPGVPQRGEPVDASECRGMRNAIQIARPDVSIAFDQDPQRAAVARSAHWIWSSADRLTVAGIHLGELGCARIQRIGRGYSVTCPDDEELIGVKEASASARKQSASIIWRDSYAPV